MTPLRARLTLVAIMAVFLATAGNALFLQERPRAPFNLAASRVSLDKLTPAADPAPSAAYSPPPAETKEARVQLALQRELARLGYSIQLQAQDNGLRLAVLAYEFDNDMPLTGEPSEAFLKQLLFNPNRAPRGVFADRAEANQALVMEVQKALLGLGFFRGAISGRMDAWTEGAVKDFERHRGLPPTGRLGEAALMELITYSGQPLQLSSR